jgi:hypothetical protein
MRPPELETQRTGVEIDRFVVVADDNGYMRNHLDWRRRHLFAPIASKRTFWIAYDCQSR